MNLVACRFRCLFAVAAALASSQVSADPLAWITNAGSSNVSVIDTATDQVSGVPVGTTTSPRAVAVSATHVYVAHDSGSLSIINKTTRMVSTMFLSAGLAGGVAVSPDGTRVYVANQDNGTLYVINAATQIVIATVPITNPTGVVVKPDGSRVYVGYDDGSTARVAVLKTATNTLLSPIGLAGREPTGLAVSPDGTRLYVCLNASAKVAAIDLGNGNVLANIPVGADPRGIVVNHAGTRAYVAEYLSNMVGIIDTTNNTVINHVSTGGNGPWGIDVSADDTRIYVANYLSDNVGIRHVVNNTVVARSVGDGPVAFGRFIDKYVPPPQVPPVLGNVPDQNATSGTPFTLDLVNHVTTTNGDLITGFTITAGSLPDGLNLDTTTGMISGTPALAGRGASITVTVSDDDGPSNADTIAFTINSPASTTPREALVGSNLGGLRGFPLDATGNVAPTRSLNGPNTQLSFAYGLAHDPASGSLFVADFTGQAIRVFDVDARGDTAPKRSLTASVQGPRVVAIDAQHGEITVLGGSCYPCFWPITASGTDEPIRRLFWGIGDPRGLAINPSQDEVYIGDAASTPPYVGKVVTLSRTANGGVNPLRVLEGSTTRIGEGSAPYLAFDPALQTLYVLTFDYSDPTYHMRVLAFPAAASGNVAPVRVIEGSNTQLDIPTDQFPYGISFDPATQRLLVSIHSNTAAENHVLAFYAGDNGNVAPLTSLGGAATGLDRIGTAIIVPVNLMLRDGFE